MKAILNLQWIKDRSVEMPSGCWHWTRHVNKVSGYGYCSVNGRPMPAHRVAYFIANNEWPDHTRHTCDNRLCINPAHLLNGTNADNVRDKVERNRQTKGETHGLAVLDKRAALAVIEARACGASIKGLAEAFSVSRETIKRILDGTHWTVR